MPPTKPSGFPAAWTVPADGFARTPLSVQALKQFDILGMVLVVVGWARTYPVFQPSGASAARL
jgi:hypothetical protein